MTYRTFIRSATNFRQFASARKITRERGLSYTEAAERCAKFNASLTSRQKRRGTRLEFDSE